ncbi:MAG: SPFH domain-containing protein [Symbiobacteriaceae bacterium]|nr:SPFH domain-containing protein [Symbiobacteriaceae bacterium]
MALIRAAIGAISGTMSDQWKEFFYCESLPENILMTKGQKRVSGRSSNISGEENIITTGSGIAVADGQFMILVEQGKIIDYCGEPGQYTFDIGGEPSLFAGGSFGQNALASLGSAFERFKYGGIPGKDTRIYYINTKEIIGNKYGTPMPIPFRVVDERAGFDIDVRIKCFGTYSFKITVPLLFYTFAGNVPQDYTRETLEETMRGELLDALLPAFGRISMQGVRYSMITMHTRELTQALNEELDEKWGRLRGIEIVSVNVSSVTADKDDEARIQEYQRMAMFRDPTMAGAALVNAQAEAMKAAASNTSTGPAMAFMGMNMANQAGGANASNLYAQGQQQPGIPQPPVVQQQYPQQPVAPPVVPVAPPVAPLPPQPETPAIAGWTCSCGQTGNTGKFCSNCGQPQPVAPEPVADTWTCSCGQTGNTGNFCANCGQPKPAAAPAVVQCSSCGWMPADPSQPVKFCANCGNPMGA